MNIILSKNQLNKCIEFSFKCAENQQPIEFGQSDTISRSLKEIGRDNLIGKIAEVAYAKMFFNRYNIIIPLDFEYYPRSQWDICDTIINNWKIDIKATRSGGKWMLIEWSKLNFRQKEKNLSHLYFMSSVGWDRYNDIPTGEVDLIGCASINKLFIPNTKTLILKKGEFIPQTNVRLQADNFAINFRDLMSDWDIIINYILNHEPPNLENYQSIYN